MTAVQPAATINWKQSNVAEALAHLYLRLNGFLTTSLILQSEEYGKNRTDVDYIAVRFPRHLQDLPMAETSSFLAVVPDVVNVIICEVKSEEPVEFNKPIREQESVRQDLLQWLGAFDQQQIKSIAKDLEPLLAPDVDIKAVLRGATCDGFIVRPLLCYPAGRTDSKRWCLVESEIFTFIDARFNPSNVVPCSPRYNFQQWGYSLAPVVDYFKKEEKPHSLNGLYDYLGVK
jgi:hypothetical protein